MSKPNEDRFKAETLYKKGQSYREISERLGIPASTLRRWKSTYHWTADENPNTRAKKAEQPEQPQRPERKKRGGQKGNVNAVSGGAPVANQNALKHGGYSKIIASTLSEEERELFDDTPDDELVLLRDEIALLTVREHRLLSAIGKYTDVKGGQAISSVLSLEKKKVFSDDDIGRAEKAAYETVRQKKQEDEVVKYFGKDVEVTTQTEATYSIVLRLERELTAVQKQKQKALETIAQIKKSRGEGNDDLIDSWISALETHANETQ